MNKVKWSLKFQIYFTLAFVLAFLIGFKVTHYFRTPDPEEYYYSILGKAGTHNLSEEEFEYVENLLNSKKPQEIRNGLGIYMIIKDQTKLKKLEEKVFSLVYHSDDEVRATALMALYKTKSRLFALAHETIENGELVSEAKRLISFKKPRE